MPTELCVEPLWYGQETNAIAIEKVFLLLCLKILLGHNNHGRLNVTVTSKVMVYAPAERFLALIHFYIKILAVTGQSIESKHCPTFPFSA